MIRPTPGHRIAASLPVSAMIPERDIYRAANVLIREHGSEATIHAAMRADELLDAGDLDGAAVWRKIVKVVEELLTTERPTGSMVH